MEGTTKDVQVKVCNIDQKPAVWTKLDVDEKISKPALLSKIRTKYPEAIDVYSEDDGDAIKIEEELLTVIKGQKFFFRREERKLGEKKEKEKKEQETDSDTRNASVIIFSSNGKSVGTYCSYKNKKYIAAMGHSILKADDRKLIWRCNANRPFRIRSSGGDVEIGWQKVLTNYNPLAPESENQHDAALFVLDPKQNLERFGSPLPLVAASAEELMWKKLRGIGAQEGMLVGVKGTVVSSDAKCNLAYCPNISMPGFSGTGLVFEGGRTMCAAIKGRQDRYQGYSMKAGKFEIPALATALGEALNDARHVPSWTNLVPGIEFTILIDETPARSYDAPSHKTTEASQNPGKKPQKKETDQKTKGQKRIKVDDDVAAEEEAAEEEAEEEAAEEEAAEEGEPVATSE